MRSLLDSPVGVPHETNGPPKATQSQSSEKALGTHRAISLVATVGLFWPLFLAWSDIVAVPWSGLAVVALTAGSLWLIAAIATTENEANLARLDRWLLVVALLVLAAWAATGLYSQGGYGTDEAAFQQQAATLLLHGHDPYGANLLPALNDFDLPDKFATITMNGQLVSTYGYPAFPIVVVAAFVKLTGGDQAVPIADIALLMLATILMFKALPDDRRALAITLCIGFPVLSTFAMAGLNAIIAMTALLVVAHRWTDTARSGHLARHDRLKAVAFGLAMATNQIAWFIAPFLLSGIYLARRSHLGRRGALSVSASYIGTAAAAFVLINVPFIVWGPQAWLQGVAAPLTQHAIPYGQGLVALTLFMRIGGGAPDAYNYAAGLLYLALLLVYLARFRKLGRACFLLPLAALFISGRSLAGYWMTLIAVIAVGVLSSDQRAIRTASQLTWPTRWRIPRPTSRIAIPAAFLPAAACLGVALATPQPLTMQILSAHSSKLLRSVDQLRVAVQNRSDYPLRAHFATNVSGQATLWTVTSGPVSVPAHASAIYALKAPDAGSMPANGTPFVVEAITASPRTISSTTAFTQRGPAPGYW